MFNSRNAMRIVNGITAIIAMVSVIVIESVIVIAIVIISLLTEDPEEEDAVVIATTDVSATERKSEMLHQCKKKQIFLFQNS